MKIPQNAMAWFLKSAFKMNLTQTVLTLWDFDYLYEWKWDYWLLFHLHKNKEEWLRVKVVQMT